MLDVTSDRRYTFGSISYQYNTNSQPINNGREGLLNDSSTSSLKNKAIWALLYVGNASC